MTEAELVRFCALLVDPSSWVLFFGIVFAGKLAHSFLAGALRR